jgi:hypothetical protein
MPPDVAVTYPIQVNDCVPVTLYRAVTLTDKPRRTSTLYRIVDDTMARELGSNILIQFISRFLAN